MHIKRQKGKWDSCKFWHVSRFETLSKNFLSECERWWENKRKGWTLKTFLKFLEKKIKLFFNKTFCLLSKNLSFHLIFFTFLASYPSVNSEQASVDLWTSLSVKKSVRRKKYTWTRWWICWSKNENWTCVDHLCDDIMEQLRLTQTRRPEDIIR